MSLEFHTKVVSWLACQEHPPVLKWAIGELELVPVVGFKVLVLVIVAMGLYNILKRSGIRVNKSKIKLRFPKRSRWSFLMF